MRGTVTMVDEQRGALLATLAELDDDAWAAPTPCAGWTVADVVAHLIEGELGVGRVLRGDTEPGFIDLTAIDRWRALPGGALSAALWQHGSATQRLLAALDEERWRAPIRAFGCRRIGQLVRLGLFEAVVHSYDVTSAAGAGPIWGDRIVAAAEHVLRVAPATLHRRGIPPEGSMGILVGDRTATLAGDGVRWALQDGVDQPRSILTIAADDLVLATTGRLPVPDALERASVEGEQTVAAAILRGWQVVAE